MLSDHSKNTLTLTLSHDGRGDVLTSPLPRWDRRHVAYPRQPKMEVAYPCQPKMEEGYSPLDQPKMEEGYSPLDPAVIFKSKRYSLPRGPRS